MSHSLKIAIMNNGKFRCHMMYVCESFKHCFANMFWKQCQPDHASYITGYKLVSVWTHLELFYMEQLP